MRTIKTTGKLLVYKAVFCSFSVIHAFNMHVCWIIGGDYYWIMHVLSFLWPSFDCYRLIPFNLFCMSIIFINLLANSVVTVSTGAGLFRSIISFRYPPKTGIMASFSAGTNKQQSFKNFMPSSGRPSKNEPPRLVLYCTHLVVLVWLSVCLPGTHYQPICQWANPQQ